MANSNTPFGLRPVQYLNGAAWTGKLRTYCIPDTDDTNRYAIGDPVTLAGSADSAGIPTVTLMTPGSAFVGVICTMGGKVAGGGFFDPSDLSLTVCPATKSRNYYVGVCDDPNVLFEVQEIGTGTTLTATEVGLNCNLVAGTDNGYVSGWLLTNTTEATTSTLDVKLMGLMQRPGNTFGQYAKWLVMPNNHLYRGGVTAV